MSIEAPLTTFTDCAIAVFSLVAAVVLARGLDARHRVSAWCWCAAFIAIGVAAAIGVVFHGVRSHFGAATLAGLWSAIMFSIGAAGAFIAAAVHAAEIRRADGTLRWLVAALVVAAFGGLVDVGLVPPIVWTRNADCHLIEIAALYLLFRCARTVHDRPGRQSEPPV